jgi:hypothetical protein
MNRSILLSLPCLVLAASLFNACGGVSAGDLFTSSGGNGAAGTPGGGGESSEGGSPASAGTGSAEPTAGESAGGAEPTAGAPAGGSNAGGAPAEGGSSAGGASAGSAQGGSGGTALGGSSAGGSGPGTGEPTCKELYVRAEKELAAAQACNVAVDSKQCTGKVKTTCGCEVPVQRGDSPETNTYEDTLKQIDKKNCNQPCPAVACAPVNFAQCRAPMGSIMGTCTSIGFQND